MSMQHFVSLCYVLTHLNQAILSSQQHSFVLMIPKVDSYILPLQKSHLPLSIAPHHHPVAQFDKKVATDNHHFQNLIIETVHLHNLAVLVYGKHVLESQCDLSSIQRICSQGELYSLDSCDLVQPDAATGQHVALDIVSNRQIVVFMTHEDSRPLLDGYVTLICFCFQIVDQQTLGRCHNQQIFIQAYSQNLQVRLKIIDFASKQKIFIQKRVPQMRTLL